MSKPGADETDAGLSRRLRVVRTTSGVWVGWPGGAKFFERERPGATARGADGDGPSEVLAPMTARVVKVAVGAGSASMVKLPLCSGSAAPAMVIVSPAT